MLNKIIGQLFAPLWIYGRSERSFYGLQFASFTRELPENNSPSLEFSFSFASLHSGPGDEDHKIAIILLQLTPHTPRYAFVRHTN